jgi:NAD(P)-dependent dehydrogenase (short-subunit alcohol dehydrogenase family)
VVTYEGRTAVITGGGSGIGRGFALALAQRGANIALLGRDRERVAAAARDIATRTGVQAESYEVDVAKPDAVERVAADVGRRFGNVHVVANNAGISTAGYAWETSLDDWHQVLGVNLLGGVNIVRSFLPRMLAAGEPGHITNVSSMGGLLPVPMKAPYTASKHALIGMAKALRDELASIGAAITVSVVCPGSVATDMIDAQLRRYANDPEFSAESRAVLEKLKAQVDQGMTADAAGIAMVEAIDRGQFWVFLNAGAYFGALEAQDAELLAVARR